MKQHYLLSILCMLLFFTHYSWGQVKIGDNPTQVNPQALLELESTEKGFLPPRLTEAQCDAISQASAPLGLMIYNIDADEIQYLREEISVDETGKRRIIRIWESARGGVPFERSESPEEGDLHYNPDMGTLSLWDGTKWVNLSTGSTSQTLQLTLTGATLSIINGNSVDLSAVVGRRGSSGSIGPTGPAGPSGPQGPAGAGIPQTLTASLTASNTINLSISGGNSQTIDLSALNNSRTDTQTIVATLSGTILQLLPENTTVTETLDLAYFDNPGTGTDTQTIAATLSGTILELLPENTTVTETLDLVYFDNTGTDDQQLTFATSTSTTSARLDLESSPHVSFITSGTISLINTDSSTLTHVGTATHGQLIQVTENGNTGYRFANADESRHGDIGDDAVDLSIQKAVVSISEGATGDSSFAGGYGNIFDHID